MAKLQTMGSSHSQHLASQSPKRRASRFKAAAFLLCAGAFSPMLHAQGDTASYAKGDSASHAKGDSAPYAHDFKEPKNSMRLSYGRSSWTDSDSTQLLDASWGRRFSDSLFDLPVPLSAHFGVQHLNEGGFQPDGYGATAFIKAEYTWLPPKLRLPVRFGFGEGLSYVSRIPMGERLDFAKNGVQSEKLMNYVHWTIDVPFRVTGPGGIREVSVGLVFWRRTSMFGLFGDKGSGEGFAGLGVEARY